MPRPDLRDDTGASAVEYGLVVVAIAAVIVGVLFALGGEVASLFGSSCDAVSNGVLDRDC
jgi:pilus assembly protein Flp/PilA